MKVNVEKEVALLSEMAQVFSESLDLETTLESVLKLLETHLKMRRGTITLLDPETETINIKVAHGLSEESKKLGIYKIGEGITGIVVQTGKEVVVPDISKDPRFLDRTGTRKKEKGERMAFFCVPIKLEGRTVGTLSADSAAGTGNDFEDCVRLLNVVAVMVGQTLKTAETGGKRRQTLRQENLRLRQELKGTF